MDLRNLKPAQMEIKVLGTGCAKCKTLEKQTLQAVEELGLKAEIIKIEDIVEIMNFGVMTTPALAINGKIVVKGKVPSVAEIKELLTFYETPIGKKLASKTGELGQKGMVAGQAWGIKIQQLIEQYQ
jgi:small redox-active disulfide protein 2